MQPDEMDALFQALAHRDRRRILDIVKNDPGCSVESVCRYFPVSRIAVLKHLRVLEQANLLHSEKQGRVRRLYFNAVPIQMIYDRWTTDYSALWAGKLTEIKYKIESQEPSRKKSRGRRHG
jgi:DNA-binding transcriptional ArsR family regulator